MILALLSAHIEWTSVLPGLIPLVLGGSIWGGVIGWRKTKPEAESISAATLIAVNKSLREEISRQQTTIDLQRKELTELSGKLQQMRKQFDELEKELKTMGRG